MKMTETYEEIAEYTGVSVDTLIRCPYYKVVNLYNAMVENKNAEARQKYREKKFQKEYEENFGWMKELAKYKREKEYEIQNDDNIICHHSYHNHKH